MTECRGKKQKKKQKTNRTLLLIVRATVKSARLLTYVMFCIIPKGTVQYTRVYRHMRVMHTRDTRVRRETKGYYTLNASFVSEGFSEDFIKINFCFCNWYTAFCSLDRSRRNAAATRRTLLLHCLSLCRYSNTRSANSFRVRRTHRTNFTCNDFLTNDYRLKLHARRSVQLICVSICISLSFGFLWGIRLALVRNYTFLTCVQVDCHRQLVTNNITL